MFPLPVYALPVEQWSFILSIGLRALDGQENSMPRAGATVGE
jgi:hypothetical protein